MINFRNSTITFFTLLLTLNVCAFAGLPVHWYEYAGLVFVYFGFSVIMSFFIRSGYHMQAYCNLKTAEKIVSLTFDDGPDKTFTPILLNVLKELEISATFFCIGHKIPGNEDLLKRIISEGHLIGTHSYSHSNWFDFYLPRYLKRDILEGISIIDKTTGKKPRLFRPPYGVINPAIKSALRGTGLHVIGFSNRAWDTSSRNKEIIISRILKNLKPGDIILLHDTIPETIESVKPLAERIKQAGYRIVSLDKLLDIPAYEK